MKGKPAFSRSSSTALLSYTNKSTVRSLPETKDCYAVDLTLNSNATQLAVLTVPLTIQLFDASTLTPVTTLSSTSNSFDASDSSSTVKITSIQFASISPHTIFASTNKNLVLGWDTRSPQQEIFQLQGCADEHKFLSVTCNSEDQLIAAGSELKGDENVAIAFWDVRAPSTKQLLGYYTESHSDDILQVKFSRTNAKKLISGSTDGLVCLYDVSQANEEDALEQVFNANGSVSKCGFAQNNTVYATTASNAFFVWSTTDDNQQLLVQGDTETEPSASETPAKAMDTSVTPPATVHHLPSTHATMVDVLGECHIKEMFPSLSQIAHSSWPLLLCDHTGKMSIAMVSSDPSEPTIVSLQSPHSEPIRSVATYGSSLYSCADDGKVVRWQSSASSSSGNNDNHKHSRPNNKWNNRKPY